MISCSSEKTNKTSPRKVQNYFVRYFKEKHIQPNNKFKHIQMIFRKEIFGLHDDIPQSLQSIEKVHGSFYKVFYLTHDKIIRYEYYKNGYLLSYAVYEYGMAKSRLVGKLIKILYYDDKKNQIAYDDISYNEFGRAIKSTRYIMPGSKLLNIF